MAKTKNESVVEKSIDSEQVAEVAVPNHANLRFNNEKDVAETSKEANANVAETSKEANANVAEVSINTKRMVFNPQNLRS